jgi:hypothetical protein
MVAFNDSFCLHCEQQPPTTGLGLCAACAAIKGVRLLYIKRRGWTPEWEAHLRRLTARARHRLPLFPQEESVG